MGTEYIIAFVIAITTTAALLALWFWVVYRELTDRKDTIKSTQIQLPACRKKHLQAVDESEEQNAWESVDFGTINPDIPIYVAPLLFMMAAYNSDSHIASYSKKPFCLISLPFVPNKLHFILKK